MNEAPERWPIRYRSADLVLAVLELVNDSADDPIPFAELVDALTGGKPDRKTIDGTIRDLAETGAIRITGHYTARNDTRRLRPTLLGAYWQTEQTPPPPPTRRPT